MFGRQIFWAFLVATALLSDACVGKMGPDYSCPDEDRDGYCDDDTDGDVDTDADGDADTDTPDTCTLGERMCYGFEGTVREREEGNWGWSQDSSRVITCVEGDEGNYWDSRHAEICDYNGWCSTAGGTAHCTTCPAPDETYCSREQYEERNGGGDRCVDSTYWYECNELDSNGCWVWSCVSWCQFRCDNAYGCPSRPDIPVEC